VHDVKKLVFVVLLSGCSFNVEVTSQRTALENQVMGAYKELEDDLVLVSSVRQGDASAEAPAVAPGKKVALDARQNQEFNRDDVEELKEKEILGETAQGGLVVLPRGTGKSGAASPKELKLAETLIAEENRDRAEVWKRIIASNTNLSEKDLLDVRKTYAKMQREAAGPGTWYQSEAGNWQKK